MVSVFEFKDYRTYLVELLKVRQKRNPDYSLRAFARDLKMPVSRLSEVLRKKSGITLGRAATISEKLSHSLKEREFFRVLICAAHSRSVQKKTAAKKRVQKTHDFFAKVSKLELDKFQSIASWYHMAILELSYLKDFKNDAKWIASTLNLPSETVHEAIERLARLGLVTIDRKGGGFKLHQQSLFVPERKLAAPAMQAFHRQILEIIDTRLIEIPPTERETTSMFVAIDSAKIKIFKQKFDALIEEVNVEALNMQNKDKLYCFSLHFTPFGIPKQNTHSPHRTETTKRN